MFIIQRTLRYQLTATCTLIAASTDIMNKYAGTYALKDKYQFRGVVDNALDS